MLAIGNFTVTKDKWRDKEVNYYLEPEYQKHAKMIFGKTPKMIEVYSKLTGVDYPWEKFSQVVARDFVSGAMENTGAVLHYEGVQHDSRQHLDNNHEDIIAHELFHQWFGDYVTARTWSQLALNESFATYGEYLWNESEYGKDFADYQFERARNSYFRSKNKHVSPNQIKLIINDDADVYTEDNKLLLRFRKNKLPQKDIDEFYDNVIHFALTKTTNRGSASGSKKKNVRDNPKIMTNIIGYFDKLIFRLCQNI
jgi:aminopeptidase N